MAEARRVHDYDVQAIQTVAIMSAIGVKMNEAQISGLNPARKIDPIKQELQKQKKENDTRMGMDLIGKVLKAMPQPRKR